MPKTQAEQAGEALKAAIRRLIYTQPFFATLALRLKLVPCTAIGTAGTNGVQLWFNPPWILGLSRAAREGLVAHEVMHVALLHPFRRGNRERLLWNVAGDYVINANLMPTRLELPSAPKGGWLAADRNKDTEQKYKELGRDPGRDLQSPAPTAAPPEDEPATESGDTPPPEDRQMVDQGGCGAVYDAPGDVQERRELEQRAKINTAQAAAIAKAAGLLSRDIETLVHEILEPLVDWREVLASFVTDMCATDYSWTRPSRRSLATGQRFYLPALREPQLRELVVAVDTSGSISDRDLDQFVSECHAIARSYNRELIVVWCDSQVRGMDRLGPFDDPRGLRPKGRGGTRYVPVFKHVEEQELEPCGLVYLTDGFCYGFPEVAPEYRVLWVLAARANAADFERRVPFGEIVQVDNGGRV